MSVSTPGRKRGRDGTGTGRPSGKLGAVAARRSGKARQGGLRFSAGVVLVFIFATTALSIYDLYLLFDFLAH